MKSTEVDTAKVAQTTTLEKVGDCLESHRNGVRVIEYLTAVDERGQKTITELYMLGDLITPH